MAQGVEASLVSVKEDIGDLNLFQNIDKIPNIWKASMSLTGAK